MKQSTKMYDRNKIFYYILQNGLKILLKKVILCYKIPQKLSIKEQNLWEQHGQRSKTCSSPLNLLPFPPYSRVLGTPACFCFAYSNLRPVTELLVPFLWGLSFQAIIRTLSANAG